TITITSSDLLELIPNSPEILTDRGPWGLKNAHTNFYASHHEPQTVTQTMFDQEVTITATPVEYRWIMVTSIPLSPSSRAIRWKYLTPKLIRVTNITRLAYIACRLPRYLREPIR